jgi:hypothetical protein
LVGIPTIAKYGENSKEVKALDEHFGIVNGAGSFLDDALLNTAKAFDDNVLDVASVGLQNWKTFQNRVAEQLQNLHPGKKIGNQITLDVTYTLPNGSTVTKTIIPDNLIQVEVNGIKKYKVIDAKTAQTDLVNKADLTSTCTQNQQPIYKMIDGDATAGTITKVEMRGGQAEQAFGVQEFVNGKATIQLEANVEFWVNSSTTDFTQYLIRPRIK